MLTATMLINGAGVITWLFPRQLADLGFPDELVLWYTALSVVSFAAGMVALRMVEARIDGAGVARRTYVLSCFIGVLGLIVLAMRLMPWWAVPGCCWRGGSPSTSPAPSA